MLFLKINILLLYVLVLRGRANSSTRWMPPLRKLCCRFPAEGIPLEFGLLASLSFTLIFKVYVDMQSVELLVTYSCLSLKKIKLSMKKMTFDEMCEFINKLFIIFILLVLIQFIPYHILLITNIKLVKCS